MEIYLEDDKKELLEMTAEENLPALLVGETGCGKTTMIRELAKSKGKKLYRINLTGRTKVDELVGRWTVEGDETVWKDGPLVKAMKDGDWVVFDEINMALPDILSKINSLLDEDRSILLTEKGSEEVKADDEFRFYATMNPSGDYSGTKQVNQALKSRFPVKMNIYYSKKEHKIIQKRTNADEQLALKLVKIAEQIRAAKKNTMSNYTCSTRDLIQCARLLDKGIDKDLAYETAIVNKAPKEDRESVLDVIQTLTGEKIEIDGREYKSLDELSKELSEFQQKKQEYEEKIEELEEALEEEQERADNLKEKKEKFKTEMEDYKQKHRRVKAQMEEVETYSDNIIENFENILERADEGEDTEEIINKLKEGEI